MREGAPKTLQFVFKDYVVEEFCKKGVAICMACNWRIKDTATTTSKFVTTKLTKTGGSTLAATSQHPPDDNCVLCWLHTDDKRSIAVTAEHRMLVSTGLWQSGYYAGWMYGREVGGVSSRELLLALGWVLAAGTLEKLLTQRVQQLDKILLPPILMKVEIPHDPLVECSSVRRLQWLIGCLKHQGRILLSMQDERASLLHAVFSTSLTSGLSSSGQSCTALNEDSVVDYHVKDAVAKRPTQIVTRAADACHPGQLAVDKLEDVLLRLKTVQKGQKTGRGDVMDRKCRLQDTLDTDMCYLESFPPLLSVSQPYRARFQAEKTVNSWSVKTLHGMVKETNELPVSQVVELLTHTERQLLEGRDTQRLANRIQLQEMIGRLNELVLITP
ncbi:uncharacterized protein tedc1 isoform X4 [Phyllopteryx taeniolatus]|uniref:uncharacterized protein tedc1 isoform X4 n=1 Tax=Phyllopteryx taeniolatus TaxID=161469 RepID=UPI002AD54061|nr:uncharacterized protein tedc1 isoform X4 [Phyllopteryx taeniolatus]